MIDTSEVESMVAAAVAERFQLEPTRVQVSVITIPPPNPGYWFEILIDGKPAPNEVGEFLECVRQEAHRKKAAS
jgi:hypothetical protein